MSGHQSFGPKRHLSIPAKRCHFDRSAATWRNLQLLLLPTPEHGSEAGAPVLAFETWGITITGSPPVHCSSRLHRDERVLPSPPRAQRTRVLQFADAAQCFDPDFLQNIESAVLRSSQAHRVIEQWPPHHRDQVFKCSGLARLVAERKPLVQRSIRAF